MASVSTSASVFIPHPREKVFAFATDSENTPRTVQPYGPFAGITKVEILDGQSLAPGVKRRVYMTDNSVLEETILAFEPPTTYSYGWEGGVKPPFSMLVRSGTGHWEFTETHGGTRVVWNYTFGLTSALAHPFALPIVWLFKGFLQRGLENLHAEVERSETGSGIPVRAT